MVAVPHMVVARQLYNQDGPAQYRSIIEDNPTLLVTWWATGCSLFIILTRCFGRYVRTMRLFRDDQWMLLSIIPLMIRLALAHVVLKYGTNNTQGSLLNDEEIRRREIGSKVVIASRVFFAVYIWIQKFCITEFYQRLTTQFWKGLYDLGLRIVRWGLLVTLTAALISTFVECQPFNHYWQVVPDPGPKCRNGGIPLFVTGVLDIFTDFVLIIFPIPAILYSKMATKRKLQLIALFSLSVIPISVASGRIPAIMDKNYLQPFRTLMASLEILAATFASNALVLSSFLRDKGPKRAKFKTYSTDAGDSRVGRSVATVRNRSEAGAAYWGSDEDLVRDTGFALEGDANPNETQDRAPSRQASNNSPTSKTSPPTGPALTRHYSSLASRPRTTNASPTLPSPPTRATTTSSIRASASNWGFPLDTASNKSDGSGSRNLNLNTDTGIAITTIETRYSPIEPSDPTGLGVPGQAFELGPVPTSSAIITANGGESSPPLSVPSSLGHRHSIGGGLMLDTADVPRALGDAGANAGSSAEERRHENGENTRYLSFSDVGGLLK
ncbi:hypothetical protein DRE_00939 [Drechslerella stenobrocha 248]|uniref:Rhodopsin domain-containing protein n=1 Tax=Drechslerella stenobrocha 248 TaxID=1043628 RepID=W7I7C6_9PEZI|nr:hypothetical protein DRE_00939 [Drechslerella stenobrocha 248]